MKVALVHDHLFQRGGAENVLLEFAKLYRQAPVYTLINHPQQKELFKDLRIQASFLDNLWGVEKHFKWYLWLMPIAWESFDFSQYDVVITSASAFCKGILTPPNTLNICYCHSPTRYLWSDTHHYVEELAQPRLIKKLLPILLNRLRIWDFMAAQRVDAFVANSNYVAKRILKYYRRNSKVIYPPVPTSEFKISSNVGNYYLIVSRLRPYKKVDLAIKAFNQLGLPLKIVGDGEEATRLKAMAKSNIEFIGEASAEVRNKLLAECRAFIHPQEEDFGITAVEAMASGRPVIAYGAGGALETVIDNVTGKFFTEQTWESLVEVVINFEQQFKDFNPQIIKQQAEKFSDSRFRQEFTAYVNEVWQDFSGK